MSGRNKILILILVVVAVVVFAMPSESEKEKSNTDKKNDKTTKDEKVKSTRPNYLKNVYIQYD